MHRIPATSTKGALGLGVLVLFAAFAFWSVFSGGDHSRPAPAEEFRPERRRGVPQPPITDLPIQSVRQAWDELAPHEPVLGASLAGEARAYPLCMLMDPTRPRKVLNDTLGGRAIAATY
jgi:hypothetical protein